MGWVGGWATAQQCAISRNSRYRHLPLLAGCSEDTCQVRQQLFVHLYARDLQHDIPLLQLTVTPTMDTMMEYYDVYDYGYYEYCLGLILELTTNTCSQNCIVTTLSITQ